jgi:hydroxyethylthiazole kinase-like uncharacterized protein yjeF
MKHDPRGPCPRNAWLWRRQPLALPETAAARAHEQTCIALLGEHVLMQRAGLSVAQLALARWPHARRATVVCGPGNNGGDGLVAACVLQRAGLDVAVHLSAPPRPGTDAAWALAQAQACGLTPVDRPPRPGSGCDLIVDALYGAGLRGSLREDARVWTRAIGSLAAADGAPVLAVDLPSGLAADTGLPDAATAGADLTLALLNLRAGHLTGEAARLVGELWFDDLGCPYGTDDALLRLLSPAELRLPALRATEHKGSRGSVGISGGAEGMQGALQLAGLAALRLGAGRVYLHPLADGAPLELRDPALLQAQALRSHAGFDVRVFGPGAGTGAAARAALVDALAAPVPVVIDADGLNLLAEADGALLARLGERAESSTVLTPHPLEMARLLNLTVTDVQADRVQAVRDLCAETGQIVLLKGAGSVVGAPGGRIWVCPVGHPRLATAGSGDVLAGAIGSLIARGLAPLEAALAGCFLHAWAGERARGDTLPASAQPQALAAALQALRTWQGEGEGAV